MFNDRNVCNIQRSCTIFEFLLKFGRFEKKKSLCNLGCLIHVMYLLRIECERQEILTKPFSHMIESSLNVYVLT